MKKLLALAVLLLIAQESLPQYLAGVSEKKITPDKPVWLSGYASRTKPSEGMLHDLWVKALAIEKDGKKVVIITSDIIGLTHELSAEIMDIIQKKHSLDRSQLILNSSHTHSGPVIWPGLSLMYNLNDTNLLNLVGYSRELKQAVCDAVDSALGSMVPSSIETGRGTASFAINRRQQGNKGVTIGVNPDGPVDHDVPVVAVKDESGRLVAVLFGYACHNTTLNGYEINGDYAGFAQAELEKMLPGAVAMYMAGCGADQNPEPRRNIENAITHGRALAESVRLAIEGRMTPLRKEPSTAFTEVVLEFPPFRAERFREELKSGDVYRRKRAVFLLEAHDRGYSLERLSYPVQAVRFGKELTIVGLGGEVVVDYSLNTKKRYPKENIFVSGYCSEVQCYIPSARIIREGGYEPDNSMIYYGLPGPFSEDVEERINAAIGKIMRKVGIR